MTAEQRLADIAITALRGSPKSWDGAKDQIFRQVRDDAELLWALFAPYRSDAVQAWLTRAGEILRQEEREGTSEKSAQPALVSTGASTSQVLYKSRRRQSKETSILGINAVAQAARRTLLDTFWIDGKLLADVTVAKARRWAARRHRDGAFIEILTADLEPAAIIGHFCTEAQCVAAMEQAASENTETDDELAYLADAE